MEIVHIIEQWPNCDNQVMEIHATTVDTAILAYLRRCALNAPIRQTIHVDANYTVVVFPDETCTIERLLPNVYTATWQLRTGVSV